MQSRQGLASILAYCKQDKKTLYDGRKLVSGVNCVAESAFNEMMNTKIQYRKTDGRMYYHLFQSFHPDEPITPETAHEIALKFAQEQFKGYEVLVATHIDREHIHSHFILNSVSAETGLKYHPDKNEIQRLRDYSDNLCRKYGLSVVIPKQPKVKQMSAREYRSADKGQSWKLQLAIAVDEAMKYATSKEHFISLMENEGYEVKWTAERKSITYTTPNGMKCRDNKLHEEKYLKENMENEFRIREEITTGIKGTSKKQMQIASKAEPFVAVTEQNWKALISTQTAQIDMLKSILDEISELTTKEEIRIYLNRQMNSLQKSIDNSNAMAQTFKKELQDMTNNYVSQINNAAKNASQQVGSTSEKYSYSISQAEEKLNHHVRILFFLALIPTAITAITEMILHIWSQISQIF